MNLHRFRFLLPLFAFWGPFESPAADRSARPPITGVAHAALYVKDIEASRAFYKDLLGYQEPFSLPNAEGGIHLTFIKVNDRQYIELFPEREAGTDRLYHISIETDDAEAMRAYLASQGVTVPDSVTKGRIGNLNFNVFDPDGHQVEIVQYMPDGWSLRDQGKFMSDARISTRLKHVGIIVTNLDASLKFYQGVLGFQETWRASRDGKKLSWVNLRVAEGDDYVELMLYDELPPVERRGVPHHLCLEVPDMEPAAATARERAARIGYTRPIEARTGINRKRQLNLYDPDGTRVEFMEPRTVDEKAAEAFTGDGPRYVGLRRSNYGLRRKNADDLWWATQAKAFASRFPGSQPTILHILSGYRGDGTTRIGISKPEAYLGPTDNMTFQPGDLDHDRALTTYDEQGVKAILQFESSNADVGHCFDLAQVTFGHHPCVIGMAIDAEWYRTRESGNRAGVPITDEEGRRWMEQVLGFNPGWVLVLKHWDPRHMPPTYRHPNLWWLTDSQQFNSQEQWASDMRYWARSFKDSKLGSQYGYRSDQNWWSQLPSPPLDLGRALMKEDPNYQMLLWVDFTADQVQFEAKD